VSDGRCQGGEDNWLARSYGGSLAVRITNATVQSQSWKVDNWSVSQTNLLFLWDLKVIIKKLMLSHYTPRRSLGERRYSSYSFLTTALDGGEWSAARPGRALAPRKGHQVPVVQEARWAPEPVWTQRLEEKSFHLCQGSNLDRPVVQLLLTELPGSRK
jgi:hypothetical protein